MCQHSHHILCTQQFVFACIIKECIKENNPPLPTEPSEEGVGLGGAEGAVHLVDLKGRELTLLTELRNGFSKERIFETGEGVEHGHDEDGVEEVEGKEEDGKDGIGHNPVVLTKGTVDEDGEKKRIKNSIKNNTLDKKLNKIYEEELLCLLVEAKAGFNGEGAVVANGNADDCRNDICNSGEYSGNNDLVGLVDSALGTERNCQIPQEWIDLEVNDGKSFGEIKNCRGNRKTCFCSSIILAFAEFFLTHNIFIVFRDFFI